MFFPLGALLPQFWRERRECKIQLKLQNPHEFAELYAPFIVL
jgi:hypothetical protein